MTDFNTLIFDLGGVIVNIDDEQVRMALREVGLSAWKQFWHRREIRRLMNDYIDGIRPTEVVMQEMLRLCRRGTTIQELQKILSGLQGEIPVLRLSLLKRLRRKYRVLLLSNINEPLWHAVKHQIEEHGFEVGDCFDGVYLSYAMGIAKPDIRIYEQMIASAQIDPYGSLYFDDREDNVESGHKVGFISELVEKNCLEESLHEYGLLDM